MHLGFAGARLSLTLTAVHLHASAFTVGVLMSLLMLVPTVVAVPVGRWADRGGFFRPTLAGAAMVLAGCAVAASQPRLSTLMATSVLVGTGFTFAHVAVNNAIGHAVAPQARARAFGAMAVAFSASGISGPLLAGLAIDHGGHAMAFGLLTVFPLAAAVLLALPSQAAPAPPEPPGERARRAVLDLLRHAPLRRALVATALVSTGWDMFTFLLPLHGARSGLSATAIGVVVGTFGAGSFAIRMAMPRLVRSFDEWRILCVTLAITSACYLAFPFFASVAALLPLAFVLGLALGCGQPLGMSLAHAAAPAGRSGEAVGVRSVVTSLSQTVLPLLSGALSAAAGLWPVFWVTAAVLGWGSWHAGRKPAG